MLQGRQRAYAASFSISITAQQWRRTSWPSSSMQTMQWISWAVSRWPCSVSPKPHSGQWKCQKAWLTITALLPNVQTGSVGRRRPSRAKRCRRTALSWHEEPSPAPFSQHRRHGIRLIDGPFEYLAKGRAHCIRRRQFQIATRSTSPSIIASPVGHKAWWCVGPRCNQKVKT
jgi:hypothetical protein